MGTVLDRDMNKMRRTERVFMLSPFIHLRLIKVELDGVAAGEDEQ